MHRHGRDLLLGLSEELLTDESTVLARANPKAEGVGIPDCATNALPKDDAGLVSIGETFAQHRRGDLRALADDVAAHIAKDDRLRSGGPAPLPQSQTDLRIPP